MRASLAAAAALLVSGAAQAATTAENAAKYEALRARLHAEFLVVGDGPGESQPADERRESEGIIRWSDSTIGLGWYLGVLATEHYLLTHPAEFPGMPGAAGDTLDELYYALRAMERLDFVADASFPPPCTQQGELNGFFIRDDVPPGFHSHFPPMVGMTSDFADPVLTNKEMSQDQVYHVLLGLALVRALVPEQTFVRAVDLRFWASDQARRILEHVSSHGWAITNPACGDRQVERGPAAGGYSHGTRAVAGFFTDGEWLPEVSEAIAFAWELSRDPSAPQYEDEDNLHMAMAIAAVGDGWGETTAADLATLMEEQDWPAYPLLHRVLHRVDAGWCTAAARVNARARVMLDELPASPDPRSPRPAGPAAHGFTVWNRFIRGKDKHYVGSPGSDGTRYNGVDYLLLHNLYALATPATWSGGNGPGVPECPAAAEPAPEAGAEPGPEASTAPPGSRAASGGDGSCRAAPAPGGAAPRGLGLGFGLALALLARVRARRGGARGARVTSAVAGLSVALLVAACGGSTTDPSRGGTGASAGAGGSAGASGAGGGAGAAGTAGAGGGGLDCSAYADETAPTSAIVRLVNARSSPIYLGGGYGCSDPMLYELRGPAPAGEALRLQLGACGYTCEDLQEHPGGCLAECMIPPTTKIAAGGHRDLVWQMTAANAVQMPAACYAEPSTSDGSCDRLQVPAPGTYRASATARTALLCADVGLCDCQVDADGACELWDPAQPDGEALGATTSFAFPSETTIVLTFHE